MNFKYVTSILPRKYLILNNSNKMIPHLTGQACNNGNKKTFILGLGTQKSGTTWLFTYLETLDNFAAPCTKELHVWDAIEGLHPRFLRPLIARNASVNILRLAMQYFPSIYFGYFRRLLAGGKTLTADISPSYLTLPLARLEEIFIKFQSIDIDVRIVFFMRDPVDRIISAFRMYKRLRYTHIAGVSDHSETRGLARFALTLNCQRRTRYEVTLENLRRFSKPENVFVGIYEKIFLSKQFGPLYDFIGSAPPGAELENTRVHAGSHKEINAEVAGELADTYCETYAYCKEYFPETAEWWRFMPDNESFTKRG